MVFMRVADVMTPNPITIRPDDSLQTVMEYMNQHGCRRIPVVENGQLMGIITDRDVRLMINSPVVLRERWQDEFLLHNTPVGGCMTLDPITIAPDAPLQDAAQVMLDKKISGLPVIESETGKLVGIITVSDLMKALIAVLSEPSPTPR
jgi:acetoin utilization protein AcuB